MRNFGYRGTGRSQGHRRHLERGCGRKGVEGSGHVGPGTQATRVGIDEYYKRM